MGRMNWSRILFGGLIAGMVINAIEYFLRTLVLQRAWSALTPAPATDSSTTVHVVTTSPAVKFVVLALCSFLVGATAVWIYAAIRPRFAGAAKAVISAAVAVWIPGYCTALAAALVLGILPAGIVFPMMATGLVALGIGVALGGWLYRDLPELKAAGAAAG